MLISIMCSGSRAFLRQWISTASAGRSKSSAAPRHRHSCTATSATPSGRSGKGVTGCAQSPLARFCRSRDGVSLPSPCSIAAPRASVTRSATKCGTRCCPSASMRSACRKGLDARRLPAANRWCWWTAAGSLPRWFRGRRLPGPSSPSSADKRYKQLQAQLEDQQKQLKETQDQVVKNRTDLESSLSSTKDELNGSIARTHEELVVLQKRGERNYFEFDLNKSKQYQRIGPITLSLRHTDTKHMNYDLAMVVDDNQMNKKRVNLYEPIWIHTESAGQPVQIVVNKIGRNTAHGYISAPKYRESELASSTAATPALTPVSTSTTTPADPNRPNQQPDQQPQAQQPPTPQPPQPQQPE